MALLLAVIGIAAAPCAVSALARLEPPDGKMLLGAWLQEEAAFAPVDNLAAFNDRINRKASFLHLGQDIPVTKGFKGIQILERFNEDSDAALLMSVYPSDLSAVTDEDIKTLVEQVYNVTEGYGRNVFLRYGPEMQGSPVGYVAQFRKVATALHARVPEKAAIVWSPASEIGTEFEANIAKYYPGDEYVDWLGLTLYYRGSRNIYPWIRPSRCPDNYFADVVDATGLEGPTWSFYRNYVAAKKKPLMTKVLIPKYHQLAQGSAGFPVKYRPPGGDWIDSPTVVSQADMQMVLFFVSPPQSPTSKNLTTSHLRKQTWWSTFLFNSTFRQAYPLLKATAMLEFKKSEDDSGTAVLRDFRSTVEPETRARFVAALDAFNSSFIWANPRINQRIGNFTEPGPKSTGALRTSAIIGGAVGGLVGLGLIVCITLVILKRRYRKQNADPDVDADGRAELGGYAPKPDDGAGARDTVELTAIPTSSPADCGVAVNTATTATVSATEPPTPTTPITHIATNRTATTTSGPIPPTTPTTTTSQSDENRTPSTRPLTQPLHDEKDTLLFSPSPPPPAPLTPATGAVSGSDTTATNPNPAPAPAAPGSDILKPPLSVLEDRPGMEIGAVVSGLELPSSVSPLGVAATPGNLEDWTPDVVGSRLAGMGVDAGAVTAMRESNVDGHALLLITADDLARIGVRDVDVPVVLRAVEFLKVLHAGEEERARPGAAGGAGGVAPPMYEEVGAVGAGGAATGPA
ncbi:hypothetical protein HDU96_009968 [Phlyctochytrium bullatum]|nr:hypothetical protein HDU96_009968 [Phlyctochytrium bullatum]